MPNLEFIEINKIDGGNAASNYSPPAPNGFIFELNQEDKDSIALITKTSLDPTLEKILGLSQSNYKLSNQTYDSSGRLLTGLIQIYPNQAYLEAGVNAITSYDVKAEYNAQGLLINYQVTEN